jgi:hypothetical protein
MGAAMRAGLVALIVFVILRAELSRARADRDSALTISIHPDVATILQLPDEIVHTWIEHHGEIMIAPVGDKLYVRPRAGTPAGVEASLEVETRTMHQTFRLLVVASAREARKDVLVLPVEAQHPGESTPEAPPGVPADPVVPPLVVAHEAAEPAASAPTSAASPAPTVGPAPAGEPAEPITAPVLVEIRSPRPEISVHAIGSLGFTSLNVSGYAPFVARQPSLAFGVRLRVARPDAWWSVEANVSGERFGGPVTFAERNQPLPQLKLKGTWLRADVSMRAQFGTKWSPSVVVGFGMQAHLRRTEGSFDEPVFSETMPRGAVLVLGIGLQRRAGNLLLGLDFQVREGGPDGYHSVGMLWTVGCLLDPD